MPCVHFGFLSHTQRDTEAKLLASELYLEFSKMRKQCWLDVKMPECDYAAMERGVMESEALIAIVTDNGVDDYFSREPTS